MTHKIWSAKIDNQVDPSRYAVLGCSRKITEIQAEELFEKEFPNCLISAIHCLKSYDHVIVAKDVANFKTTSV